MSELSGKIQTVCGPIEPAELGYTLTHEHLLLDISLPQERDDEGFELTIGNLGRVRRHWDRNPHDARLTSIELAIAELQYFKNAGGSSLVECTSIGLERDPAGMRRIAEATGLNIIMGCSYYVHHYHPPEVAALSETELTGRIVREIVEGAGDTGIRAGIIGEVGLYWPVHPDEIKALRASAAAQRETGAALMIHPGRNSAAPLAAVRVVEQAGGDLDRTIMAHIDRTLFEPGDMRALAQTGCVLEFDLFGQESSYYPLAPIDMPNDATRIDHLQRLIDEGFREQLVVAQDICHKHGLKRYGGDGYSHILENIVPLMRRKGLAETDIEAILINNPARLLTFH
jgi:phosphotriesterase-related protein